MSSVEFGFLLPNGIRIVHGAGAATRDAFPPAWGIPGRLQTFSGGHVNDPSTPCFAGPQGLLPFDTETRMPRHIMVMEGVAVAELGGEFYVLPPHTLVLIGAGVPHTWTACPPGIDFGALGFSTEEKVVSKGKFVAVFEYEAPTSFFPTAQTNTLATEEEYVRCDDLHAIRIPAMTAEEIQRQAWFVWGKEIRKLPPSQN
ncbi:hypothetical protein KXW98_006595 [Aspergillus fumigatus]|nr:hypothetical protein KXX30_006591 [Aspergillus fumigatus]KAH1274915.1 hypothetical protein KXX48_005769 [Aspergillus fumigatus]KAH1291185.1 hypothetical protein KXX11_000214 [Aspergillus fumigatus]KAH1308669.1 hypothetical protein KXX47_007596 [Aspergillus fumigatus]KAH1376735.1 hypothetical protein KXX50_009610 [Aspergillus fumigatus]